MLNKQRLAYLLVPLCCYLATRLSLSLSFGADVLPIMWLPNGLLLAALLLFGGRGFGRLLFLGVAAEVAAVFPTANPAQALLHGLINALEVGLAYWLLRRWQVSLRFTTLADLGKFALAGPVIAALVAAGLHTLVGRAVGGAETGYAELLRLHWFGGMLGLLVSAPLGLTLAADSDPAALPAGPARTRADLLMGLGAAALVVLMLAAHNGIVGGLRVAPGLLLIFVIYAAARFEVRWTALAVAGAALLVVALVAMGRQPFGDLAPRMAVIEAQRFILIMSLMALGLAALLAQIREQQVTLAAANATLQQLNQDLEARVAERTAELRALNETLAELAQTDALTGLLNRRAFLAAAEREIERSRRHQHELAILMIDMDYFKAINDQFGHPAGDLVLQRTAALIAGVIRVTDLLARFGGEEFVLLAPETSLAQARVLAARVQQAVREQTIDIDQGAIQTTVSLGLTMLPAGGEDVGRLIQRADAALYAAKDAGRNRIVTIEPEAAPTV